MTRLRTLVARALLLALLLVTLGGSIAVANGPVRTAAGPVPLAFPDDPGFTP